MHKLIQNSSSYSDLLHDLRARGSALGKSEEALSDIFRGSDLVAQRTGFEHFEAKQFGRELFSKLFEDSEQLDKKANWASVALDNVEALPEFQMLQNRCNDDSDISAFTTAKILTSLKDILCEIREEQKEQDDMFKNTPPEKRPEFDCDEDSQSYVRGKLSGSISEIIDEIEELKESLEMAFGNEATDPSNDGEFRADLIKRIQSNPELKKVLKMAGSMLRDISSKLVPDKEADDTIVGIEEGRDLKRLTNQSRFLLCNEITESMFYAKYCRNELSILKYEGESPKERGPLIVMIDESGSMSGSRNTLARAIAVASVHIARKDDREVTVIGFDGAVSSVYEFSGSKAYECVPRSRSGEKRAVALDRAITYLATIQPSGGTSFDAPLREAMRIHEGKKRADFIFITDGWCTISPDVLEKINKVKEDGLRIFTILLGCNAPSIEAISDEIVDLEKLKSGEDITLGAASVINSATTK